MPPIASLTSTTRHGNDFLGSDCAKTLSRSHTLTLHSFLKVPWLTDWLSTPRDTFILWNSVFNRFYKHAINIVEIFAVICVTKGWHGQSQKPVEPLLPQRWLKRTPFQTLFLSSLAHFTPLRILCHIRHGWSCFTSYFFAISTLYDIAVFDRTEADGHLLFILTQFVCYWIITHTWSIKLIRWLGFSHPQLDGGYTQLNENCPIYFIPYHW